MHGLCFLRRNSTFEYFAHVIVNILLVLIPTLVIPLCIFYDFADFSKVLTMQGASNKLLEIRLCKNIHKLNFLMRCKIFMM